MPLMPESPCWPTPRAACIRSNSSRTRSSGWIFAADEAGGVTMSVVLIVDGEQCDHSCVGMIGLHGMHQVVDGVLRLGRFEPAPGRTLLNVFSRDERVR